MSLWKGRERQPSEPVHYQKCIYCGEGYLKPTEINFHGKTKIVYRCSKCGKDVNYGKTPEMRPVKNTDKWVRDPSRIQRKNPFAP